MTETRPVPQNLFTLVTYLPEPLSTWLTELRELLPVHASSQPHLTILPPRPLTIPLDEARQRIANILSEWRAFEIELSAVRVFPESDFLYLEVSDGEALLRRLHAELNTGDFAYKEVFEFHPHVTIGGPVPAGDLDPICQRAEQAWVAGPCPCRFTIDEVAFVSIAVNGKLGDWRRIWVQELATEKAHGTAVGAAVTSQTY